MTNDRGTPPSFAPGADRRPPRSDDEPVVVVGGAPASPVRRPTPPPAPRVTARPGGSAQPVPSFARTGAPPAASIPPAARPSRPAAPAPIPAAAPRRSGSSPRASSGSSPRSSSGSRPGSTPPPVRPAARPTSPAGPPPGGTARRRHRVRTAVVVVVVLLVLALAWPVGLAIWANKQIQHTTALSGAANTPGTTYLLAGSDSRGDGGIPEDGTLGARTDTILLLHVPEHGPTALISLPRDTYVDIDGHGPGKLNAAFSYGGAPLLVRTVEELTGLTVDHYAEIGLGGVKDVVDAVGGVNLCYDRDVNDADSGMVWTAGCHDVDGTQALAFSRMRKADPEGDIGREKRQRQLIGAVLGKVDVTRLVWHPSEQVSLVKAGTGALTLDEGANIRTLASLALAFRAANGNGGVTGTPPIKSLDYRPGGVGSTVLLDPDKAPTFWAQVRDGELQPGQVGGIPG